MSKFDDLIVAWRKEMSAAGIGPGLVRDELECHLRDGYDSRVHAGMDPATAFTDAAAKLGAPTALRQEYNTAVTRWTRVKRFFGRRVELFPSDMTLCAWAAIPGSLWLIYETAEYVHSSVTVTDRHSLAYGLAAVALWALPALMVGGSGLFHATRFLARRNRNSGLQLAFLWTFVFWLLGLVALMMLQARNHEFVFVRLNDGSLTVLVDSPPGWAILLTLVTALVAFMDWSQHLPPADDVVQLHE